MKNDDIREEIETKICNNFDCIGIIDVISYSFYHDNSESFFPKTYPIFYSSTKSMFISALRGEKSPPLTRLIAENVSLKSSQMLPDIYLHRIIPELLLNSEDGEDKCLRFLKYVKWREKQKKNGRSVKFNRIENENIFMKHLWYEKYRDILNRLKQYGISDQQQIDTLFDTLYTNWYNAPADIPVSLLASATMMILMTGLKSTAAFELLADQHFPRTGSTIIPENGSIKQYGAFLPYCSPQYKWEIFNLWNYVPVKDISRAGYQYYIRKAIVADIMGHSTDMLSEMIARGDVLAKSPITSLFKAPFLPPVSQYVFVLKDSKLSLYACDPNIGTLTSRMQDYAKHSHEPKWEYLTPKEKELLIAFQNKKC